MTIAPSGIERWNEGDTQPQTKFNILATSHNLWVSGKVLSRTTDAQPGSPAEGDAYIITATPSGAAWSAFTTNYVAQYLDGAWSEYAPFGGVRVYVADEAVDVRWSGSAWAIPTAANEFADNLFRIQDNADDTKELAFEVSAITTGTTRTITMPDKDVTLGELEGTDVLSTGEAGGTKFLREDGDGTCSWQAVSASVEGTDVLSTGPVTDGHVLTADGAGGAAWEAAPSGTVTLLGSDTVAGAAATSMTVSGLDLSAYKAFRIVGSLKNATGSTSTVSLYYNADSTATNYHRTYHIVAATISSGQTNDAVVLSLLGGTTVHAAFDGVIVDGVDGKPRAKVDTVEGQTSSQRLMSFGHQWVTAANVTSITLTASVASSLDIGSTVAVYGIA